MAWSKFTSIKVYNVISVRCIWAKRNQVSQKCQTNDTHSSVMWDATRCSFGTATVENSISKLSTSNLINACGMVCGLLFHSKNGCFNFSLHNIQIRWFWKLSLVINTTIPYPYYDFDVWNVQRDYKSLVLE